MAPDQEFLDKAALAALPILLSHDFDESHKNVCERAYRVADALLAEKNKRAAAQTLPAAEPKAK